MHSSTVLVYILFFLYIYYLDRVADSLEIIFKKISGAYPLDNTASTTTKNNDFPNLSQLYAFFGQFVTHDMVDTSTTTGIVSLYITMHTH